MNRDELSLLKDYVKSLESENESRNRERASLQIQLEALSSENSQLRTLRPGNQAHLLAEQNMEIQSLKREIDGLRMQRASSGEGKQLVGDIAFLKDELGGLQAEITRAKIDFKAKEDSWENDRRSLMNENSQLKSALSGADVKGEFEKLRVAYSRLEIDLNNKIVQLQTINRILESQKNRFQLERDNLKLEKDRLVARINDFERQRNAKGITPHMQPDNSQRISQLNSVISDLNSQLQQRVRQREFERGSQTKPESERVAELAGLVEDLNSDRNKIRGDLDLVRTDRDRLAVRISELQREKTGMFQQINRLRSQSAVRIGLPAEGDWVREKNQLLQEIANLKGEKNNSGWVVDSHNKRIDELQRENNLLKAQLQNSHGLQPQLMEYRRKEELTRKEVQMLTGELGKLAQLRRQADAEIIRGKGEIANLLNANGALQQEVMVLRQGSGSMQAASAEIHQLQQTIKELERRIYVLESANYNLSEELNRNLQQSKNAIGFDHILQAMKTELLEMKVENERLVQINNDLLVDYRECSDKLRQEREKGNSRLGHTRQPSPNNLENHYQQSRLQYVQQPPSPSKHAGVFEQRWEDNDPHRQQYKLYVAHPAQSPADGKWNNLQRRINALKQENDELKRSLHMPL